MTERPEIPIDPTLPLSSPDAYVEAMVKRAGTSFFWGMRRLEPARRRGIFAVYAFCRDVDDIADGDLPLDHKIDLLFAWRNEVGRIFDGSANHPISVTIIDALKKFDLKHQDFIDVIDGMEMDAHPRVRINDIDELELYCDRVACAVGRLCVPIFGLKPQEGIELSRALGLALQLTNILRDITEDAGRDRVYLPADMLQAAGANGDAIEDVLTAPKLPEVCEALAARAGDYFAQAQSIISKADPGAARPALMMMEVYHRVYLRLLKRGWNDLNQDVGLSKFSKILIAVRYGLFN